MIPVTQTKVVVKNAAGEMVVRGNCFAAAIASLMEVPITEVPNVEVLFDVDNISWYFVMQAWVNSKGYYLGQNISFSIYHNHGFDDEGFKSALSYTHDKYYIASGISPRGIRHCCIYLNGLLVHDPHPSRDGLENDTIDMYEEITKLHS